jgi:HAD superfamily hydrolase (TIGR01509 family)
VRKGLFVDLDGTLADSVTALKGAYHSFLGGFGAAGTEVEFQGLNGPPLTRVVESLKEAHDLPGELRELTTLYSMMIREAHGTAPPLAGARVVLELARKRGWRIAVVTSSPHVAAREWVNRTQLFNQVDAVVGGDEVVRGKPAPDPYSLALARVNCKAAFSLAVEDSPIGALSAVCAGLPTCVLADPRDRSDWPAEVRFIDRLTDVMEFL